MDARKATIVCDNQKAVLSCLLVVGSGIAVASEEESRALKLFDFAAELIARAGTEDGFPQICRLSR